MKGTWKQTLLVVFVPFLISLPLACAAASSSLYTLIRIARFAVIFVLAVRLRKQYQSTPHKSWNVPLLAVLAVSLVFGSMLLRLNTGFFYRFLMPMNPETQFFQMVVLEQLSFPDLLCSLLFSFEIVFLNLPARQKRLSVQD